MNEIFFYLFWGENAIIVMTAVFALLRAFPQEDDPLPFIAPMILACVFLWPLVMVAAVVFFASRILAPHAYELTTNEPEA